MGAARVWFAHGIIDCDSLVSELFKTTAQTVVAPPFPKRRKRRGGKGPRFGGRVSKREADAVRSCRCENRLTSQFLQLS